MSDSQTKRRFCAKCSVLFYNGFDSQDNRHQPAGGRTDPVTTLKC